MKLVAIPGAVPPHSHFGKPLRSHREGSLVAGTRYHFGKLVVKLNAELHGLSRWNRPWESHLYDGAVVGIVVVRRYELQFCSEVAFAGHFEFLDVNRTEVARLPCLIAIIAMSFTCKTGVRLKAVQIEVKRKR